MAAGADWHRTIKNIWAYGISNIEILSLNDEISASGMQVDAPCRASPLLESATGLRSTRDCAMSLVPVVHPKLIHRNPDSSCLGSPQPEELPGRLKCHGLSAVASTARRKSQNLV